MDKLAGKVSVFSAQGVRHYQEDRSVSIKKKISSQESGWILAVMDGHAGFEAAEFCVQNLESYFGRSLGSKKQVDEGVLKETVSLLNRNTRHMVVGTTLSLVFISETNSKALVAVLGDSPVIILDQIGKLSISPEHNVRTNPLERDAAVKRGAYYAQGYIWVEKYGLQMSRALGDNGLDHVLSREPEIYKVDLGPNSFVVVASDGVFDLRHSETANQIERMADVIRNTPAFNAMRLVNEAISRQTGDNATAIIWKTQRTNIKSKK